MIIIAKEHRKSRIPLALINMSAATINIIYGFINIPAVPAIIISSVICAAAQLFTVLNPVIRNIANTTKISIFARSIISNAGGLHTKSAVNINAKLSFRGEQCTFFVFFKAYIVKHASVLAIRLASAILVKFSDAVCLKMSNNLPGVHFAKSINAGGYG
jgi:hypothetical protein